MSMSQAFRHISTLSAIAAVSGFVVGCVITTNIQDKECGDLGTHSELQGGDCVCEAGYDWCDPDDIDDINCCRAEGMCPDPNSTEIGGRCFCDPGYDWCDPDDVNDLTCCEDGGGTGTDGTDTDGGGKCAPGVPPPDGACEEGLWYCTNVDENCLEDSQFFVCQGGVWVEDTDTPDLSCVDDGADFAYGCWDDGQDILFGCGDGPGSACTMDDDVCASTDAIHFCEMGRLTEASCSAICQDEGDGTTTYDHGECAEDGGDVLCECCDFDEAGCGDGGTGTDSGGSSSSTGG